MISFNDSDTNDQNMETDQKSIRSIIGSYKNTTHDYNENESTHHKSSIKYFKDLNLRHDLLKGLDLLNIKKLNKLQKSILPILLDNKNDDLFFRIKPHSCKTTAFLIAALNRVNIKLDSTQILILLPTTELVLKTGKLAKRIAKFTNIRIKSIVRDTNDNEEKNTSNYHVLIVSTGTYLYLKRDQKFNKSKINLVIFIELDLLLCSDSAQLKVRKILTQFCNRAQIQCTSNLIGNDSYDFVNRFTNYDLLNYNHLDVRECFKNINQFYFNVDSYDEKFNLLIDLLDNTKYKKVLIYVLGKSRACDIYDRIIKYHDAILLVSKSSLDEREQQIRKFRKSKKTIMVLNYPLTHCIDLDDIDLLINFDLSQNEKSLYYEYLHKCTKLNISSSNHESYVVNFVNDDIQDFIELLEDYYDIRMIKLNRRKDFDIFNQL